MKVFYLATSLFSGWLIRPYDTSALLSEAYTCAGFLSPLAARWDALWMGHTARAGYQHEQQLAFFPLCPILASVFSNGLAVDCPELAGSVVSMLCHVIASPLVFSTTQTVCSTAQNESAAYAVALWALNPAMPFYSSCYADAPFALLAFLCLRCALDERLLLASGFAVLAAFLRSNGALLAAPLLACALVRWRRCRKLKNLFHVLFSLAPALPSLAFQLVAVKWFCFDHVSTPAAWCSDQDRDSKMPLQLGIRSLPYTYVQSRYWGVGFLTSWRLQQVPNIMLGLPAIAITACALLEAVCAYPRTMLTLCLLQDPVICTDKRARQHRSSQASAAKATDRTSAHVTHPAVVGATAAWGVMGATAALVMHIQVSTRLMSAWPPCIWYLARKAAGNEAFAQKLFVFCGVYATTGSVLFATFYPWT